MLATLGYIMIFQHSNLDDAIKTINNNILNLIEFTKKHYLIITAVKTKIMLVGP